MLICGLIKGLGMLRGKVSPKILKIYITIICISYEKIDILFFAKYENKITKIHITNTYVILASLKTTSNVLLIYYPAKGPTLE